MYPRHVASHVVLARKRQWADGAAETPWPSALESGVAVTVVAPVIAAAATDTTVLSSFSLGFHLHIHFRFLVLRIFHLNF